MRRHPTPSRCSLEPPFGFGHASSGRRSKRPGAAEGDEGADVQSSRRRSLAVVAMVQRSDYGDTNAKAQPGT